MLAALRRGTNHFATKIFLGVLVLTFVVWGVGDIFKDNTDSLALKVGDTKYTHTEWVRFYRSQFDRMSDENKAFYKTQGNVLQRNLLGQFINSALLNQEVKRLGIQIGDDAIKYEIINNIPNLTTDGKFNKDLLVEFLRRVGLSESEFLQKLREELSQKALLDTISAGSILNERLLEQTVTSWNSKRVIEIFKADSSTFAIENKPSNADLQTVLEQNLSLFTVPEKRNVSFFKLKIEDVSSIKEDVSDQELESFYKERSYLFAIPEKRKFLKLVSQSQKEASATHKQLLDGADFKALATSLNNPHPLNEATATKEGFSEEVARAIFTLHVNDFSNPVKTPVGWCIFQVTDIIPEFLQPFSMVREEIKNQIIEQRRHDRYATMLQNIDQDIDHNKSIEEIAQKYNLKIQDAIVTPDLAASGSEPLLGDKNFSHAAFSTAINALSNVTATTHSDLEHFVIKVTNIGDEYVMPFDSIREQLLSIWEQAQKSKIALDALANFREKMIKGESKSQPQYIKVSKQTLSLQDQKEFSTKQLIEVFTTNIGDCTGVLQNVGGNNVFVKVQAYIAPDADLVAKEMSQEASKLNNLHDVIINDYFVYLRKIHKIEIYNISLPNFS